MIRGFSQRVRNLASEPEVRHVVSCLQFAHLDPGGREITDIGNCERRNPLISVRLDRQANTTAGAANLQVQVNNAALSRINLNQNEGTTIAQVLVPPAIYRAAVTCPELNVRAHLENIVRSALLCSYNSMGCQFTIGEA
jgi:hypothetical protein